MSDQIRPNLFHYATGELSQDAFICWLAAWADPRYKGTDSALHEVARSFIASMIKKVKPEYDLSTLKAVNVRRQVGKLDVLIEINKLDPDAPGELAILVEDKTHTSNHSNQLNRYYGQVKDMKYTDSQMIPLYFKTGYQSRFDTLGFFKTYLRKDFLTVLRSGKDTELSNNIFIDFLAHLENIESAIQQFSGKTEWEGNDWQGFYMVLFDSISDTGANWDYVANPSGGFFGFWWYFRNKQQDSYTPYLQLEEENLCFKIMVDDGSDRRSARDEAFEKLRQIASRSTIEIQRPDRMGNGRFMTVARRKGGYRVFNNGTLDMTATLADLKKAQDLLDAAFGG